MGQDADRTLTDIEEIRSRLRGNAEELRRRIRRPAAALGGIGVLAGLSVGAMAVRRLVRGRRAQPQRVVFVPESASGGGGWAKAAAAMAAASLALTLIQLRRARRT